MNLIDIYCSIYYYKLRSDKEKVSAEWTQFLLGFKLQNSL